jgi:hypothetical protein
MRAPPANAGGLGRRTAGLLAAALAMLLIGGGGAFLRADTVFSRSGQFIVQSNHPTVPSLSQVTPPDKNGRVLLQTPLLAVSCERIKSALLRELGLRDQWRGQIHVRLVTTTSSTQQPSFTAHHFADGWRYFVVTPDEIRPEELVRTMVSVLLLEMANRFPGPHPATVPYWLAEGLTAAVMSRMGPDLVVGENQMLGRVGGAFGKLMPNTRERVYGDRLVAARKLLRDQPPLSFEDLSLPRPETLQGEAKTLYRASALAFLVKLRQLPRGDLRLKQMLAHLTQHLNWQTAFLQAYKPIFHSLLEVEKWWALARIQFIGEGAAEAWPPQRGLDILGQLLSVTLSTRNAPGAPARRVPVSLQQAVRRLALADFVSVARLKQRQLAAVAARLPREVGLLGREYRILLERYLTAVHQASARTRGQLVLNRRQSALLRELVRQLDRLDRRRENLRRRLVAEAEAAARAEAAGQPAGPQPATPPPVRR